MTSFIDIMVLLGNKFEKMQQQISIMEERLNKIEQNNAVKPQPSPSPTTETAKVSLSTFGYCKVKTLSQEKRHTCLWRAVRNTSMRAVINRLKHLVTVSGNLIFKADLIWLQSHVDIMPHVYCNAL